LKSL
jgi:hypothetical protein